MFSPLQFDSEEVKNRELPPFIDQWIPITDEDKVIKWEAKDILIMPISALFGFEKQTLLDFFYLTPKRGYRLDKVRLHTSLYLNYFEKFFDQDHELITVYANIKYMIDNIKEYEQEHLFNDIKQYVLSPSLRIKVRELNEYNYSLNLQTYVNKKNPVLQYNDSHGKLLMELSFLFNMVYPLLTHFLYARQPVDVETDEFIMEMYDYIMDMYDVDIYNKIYETSSTNINKHRNSHPIWEKQDIRGKNVTTHSLYTAENIILNGIVKYVYNQNIVSYNVSIIGGSNDFQITDIDYELDYRPLSSIDRDNTEGSQSSFDKFENYLTKENEALFLQNKVNCAYTMKRIEEQFGPFSDDEINFYKHQLTEDGKIVMNEFQKDYLIFNLFYKYFGDTMSIQCINIDDYIKLMAASKRILLKSNLVVLPYIFSSKVNKLVKRKMLNKKELTKIQSSKYYHSILDKYRNDKIEDLIIEIVATILSSEFQIIEYDKDIEINGKLVNCIAVPEIIAEEVLMFITMI